MKVISFNTIDSTNKYLKSNYEDLQNFTIIDAKKQTNGKGRNDRVWESDQNNLLFSLLIKDEIYFDKYKILSILSAYSILQILKQYQINNLSIKWPNDVYVNDKKICGILLEAVSKEKLNCLIVGIGLNINQDNFPLYNTLATSMKLELNKQIDIEEIKNKIYLNLLNNIKNINNCDYYKEIKKYDYLKNKDAYALIHNKKELIKVIGIDKDYSLRIKMNDKELNIEAGEISFNI